MCVEGMVRERTGLARCREALSPCVDLNFLTGLEFFCVLARTLPSPPLHAAPWAPHPRDDDGSAFEDEEYEEEAPALKTRTAPGGWPRKASSAGAPVTTKPALPWLVDMCGTPLSPAGPTPAEAASAPDATTRKERSSSPSTQVLQGVTGTLCPGAVLGQAVTVEGLEGALGRAAAALPTLLDLNPGQGEWQHEK
jgi:hypothetical protein